MAIAILAALLAQAGQAPAAERMAAHMVAAERGVARIRFCAERDPEGLEETHRAFDARLVGLKAAGAELFAAGIGATSAEAAEEEEGGLSPSDCGDTAFAAARDGAEAAMDSAQALVDEALGPERRRGLWFGGLRVCEAQAVGASDDHGGGVTVLLHFEQAAELERVTGERVGRSMPIWVDGKVISAPVVREAVSGGAVAISGPAEEGEKLTAAAKAAC